MKEQVNTVLEGDILRELAKIDPRSISVSELQHKVDATEQDFNTALDRLKNSSKINFLVSEKANNIEISLTTLGRIASGITPPDGWNTFVTL